MRAGAETRPYAVATFHNALGSVVGVSRKHKESRGAPMKKMDKKENILGGISKIARGIGLSDKIGQAGWGSLTSAEAGRIGLLLSGQKKSKRRGTKN